MATPFTIQLDMIFDDFGDQKPPEFTTIFEASAQPFITEGIIEWPPVETSTPTTTTITLKFTTESAYYRSIPTVDAICKALGKNFPTRVRTDL